MISEFGPILRLKNGEVYTLMRPNEQTGTPRLVVSGDAYNQADYAKILFVNLTEGTIDQTDLVPLPSLTKTLGKEIYAIPTLLSTVSKTEQAFGVNIGEYVGTITESEQEEIDTVLLGIFGSSFLTKYLSLSKEAKEYMKKEALVKEQKKAVMEKEVARVKKELEQMQKEQIKYEETIKSLQAQKEETKEREPEEQANQGLLESEIGQNLLHQVKDLTAKNASLQCEYELRIAALKGQLKKSKQEVQDERETIDRLLAGIKEAGEKSKIYKQEKEAEIKRLKESGACDVTKTREYLDLKISLETLKCEYAAFKEAHERVRKELAGEKEEER